MAILGNGPAAGSSTSMTTDVGYVVVSGFTLATPQSLDELHGWVSGGSGAITVRWCIWKDISGGATPEGAILVAYTNPLPLTGALVELSQAGLNGFLLPGVYWIGFRSSATGGVIRSTAGGTYSGIAPTPDPPINPWTSVGYGTASGAGTASIWAVVSTSPASFTASASGGPAPLTVNFTDTSSDSPTAWDWDFGDGSAHGTAQNPTHVYTVRGDYTVTLTTTSPTGAHKYQMLIRVRAVFLTGVLDNFNRAPVDPLAPNWSMWGQAVKAMMIWTSRPNMVLMDDGISSPSFYAMAYTGAGTWSDSEAYLTIIERGGSNSVVGVMLRCTNIGSTTTAACCYARVQVGSTYSSSTLAVGIGSGGVLQTPAATSSTFTLNPGDLVGARVYDVSGLRMIEGWFNGVDTGHVWKRLVAYGDLSMTIPASGYPGMLARTNIGGQIWVGDDFSGGPVTVPATTVNSEAFPANTGALASAVPFVGGMPAQVAARVLGPMRPWMFPASGRPSRIALPVPFKRVIAGTPPPVSGGISGGGIAIE